MKQGEESLYCFVTIKHCLIQLQAHVQVCFAIICLQSCSQMFSIWLPPIFLRALTCYPVCILFIYDFGLLSEWHFVSESSGTCLLVFVLAICQKHADILLPINKHAVLTLMVASFVMSCYSASLGDMAPFLELILTMDSDRSIYQSKFQYDIDSSTLAMA